MKNLIIILMSFLAFINCPAQKRQSANKMSKKHHTMEIPNITKNDIEILGLSDFIQENLKSKNDSKELTFEKNGFIGSYKDGKITLLGKITEDNTPELNSIRRSGQKFEQYAQTFVYFYPDSKIHIIKQTINTPNGYFNAGNWYVYDEAGNLLQHIDHEKHFKMTYYEIAQIADSYGYSSITIARYFDNKNSYWQINLNGVQDEPVEPKIIIINDKTGKVLRELKKDEFYSFQSFFLSSKKYQEDLYKLFKHD